MAKGKLRANLGEAQAFIDAAVASNTDDCILWPYSVAHWGYGQICVNGRNTGAHREALRRATGDPEPGMEACHRPHICSQRACINPRHLYWGTRQQNDADKDLVGTRPRGERVGGSKLTLPQVREIKGRIARGQPLRAIAADYGVGEGAISHIKTGRRWSHA